jgi:3-phenylpropionate/trans-cinnamate dioxygenase ferredoxin reductase component
MSYEKLLIATGARARRLPLASTGPVATLRTMSDAPHIASIMVAGTHVGIVGAGLIGLELAAQLRAGDVEVTIIEATPAALGRAVPPELADLLVQRHRDEGVRFEFDARITAIGT